MNITKIQLAALKAARDGGGLVKTGVFWHDATYEIVPGTYWPDQKHIFSTETVESLHAAGLLTGGGLITAEGVAAIKEQEPRRKKSRKQIAAEMEAAFAQAAQAAGVEILRKSPRK